MPKKNQPFATTRRVEFRDTDAAGIMHFTVYFQLMEQVEHEFLRKLGLSVLESEGDEVLSWPRVAAKCEYLGVLQFEDEVHIELAVQRLGKTSVTYVLRFFFEGNKIAEGEVTAVCCKLPDDSPPVPVPIPERFRSKLAPYVLPTSPDDLPQG